jgi:putative PIN family toxin of toxin-antitoxin system
MRNEGEFIEIIIPVTACRDPKDDFLLSLAKDGKATHLITRDKDLLDIKYLVKQRF